MICSKCGTLMKKDETTCHACGTAARGAPAPAAVSAAAPAPLAEEQQRVADSGAAIAAGSNGPREPVSERGVGRPVREIAGADDKTPAPRLGVAEAAPEPAATIMLRHPSAAATAAPVLSVSPVSPAPEGSIPLQGRRDNARLGSTAMAIIALAIGGLLAVLWYGLGAEPTSAPRTNMGITGSADAGGWR